MRAILLITAILAATPVVAQTAAPSDDDPDHGLSPLTARPLSDFEHPAPSGLRFLNQATARYTAPPSGLDRIDPANLRVFGGEIGGNGVKGGAVVSLTWSTEP